MINRIIHKERAPEFDMFMSANELCKLEQQGYLEEEYFFSGTANVYGENGKGGAQILFADAPYTNRLVVRRPQNAHLSSGRVIVEILNSSSYMDIDRVWILAHRHLLRNNDVYIGVTSKPITMKTLRKFNKERYAPLSWNNPRACPYPAEALGNFKGASNPETEDGLFWDMLSDLAAEIRHGAAFLADVPVKQVYLAGWSQSAGYMVTYTNYFAKSHHDESRSPLFDGYFAAGAAPMVAPALNQCEYTDLIEGQGRIAFAGTPYLLMQTESENAKLGTFENRLPFSDNPLLQCRYYDISGSTHDSVESMTNYYRGSLDMQKTGCYLTYPGKEPNANDFPYYFAICAGLQCLYLWVEKNILPPDVEPIPVDEHLNNLTDNFGNAQKGWRLPEIDVPVCQYRPHASSLHPNDSTMLYGCEIPFEQNHLRELYGTLSNYRRLVEQTADKAVQNLFLLPQDREECIAHSVAKAAKYGLS